MRKFLSILIGLIMCVLAEAKTQHGPYSLSIDSIEQGKIVNLQVSNNPNIMLQDGTKADNLVLYRVEQMKLFDSVKELTTKVNNLQIQSVKERIATNQGYTDKEINAWITINLWITILTAIGMFIFYMFTGYKPDTPPKDLFVHTLTCIILYGFIGICLYYLLTMFFNPDYLILKGLLNLLE